MLQGIEGQTFNSGVKGNKYLREDEDHPGCAGLNLG